MKINTITIRRMNMTMKHPFTTSFGTIQQKDFLLATVEDLDGHEGWGESVAFTAPWYSEETTETTIHMLRDFLIPAILGKTIGHPDEVSSYFASVRKNNMAKATIEGAVWDLYAKHHQMTLAAALGGKQERIEVGISIGIEENVEDLLETIKGFIKEGYKRIKVKIKPGYDVEVIRAIREVFPDIPLMADANSAYTLDDTEMLKELDQFNLMMIEQPLASDDIIDHAKLQQQIQTPICLDESIHSLEDARKAVELGSCKIINVKIGRVGGLTEAKKIHDYCASKGIDVWCGGMLESGIGRAQNVALTTLPNFTLPGDTAGSSRYWEQDIILPEVVAEDGYITVPEQDGIGYQPDMDAIDRFTVDKWVFSAE
ncbi:o-succinylbenzoate synthase [Sporosarcina sp. P37]|uniref:o-succinylbenzoate synthase n=1 Tax=unclassified Sporosarcina TaxID=2647733 RepID=UPI000A17D709|nr:MULTISPECIES: o-succinylbenzoate synthase [unclassified Sporosarcina]ARK23914.1 o-succinylbenzoate synthase [Sporosarcina sp. P37]PID17716.1 o-succinylbenzoate synthase [Sporosarcina sp. P35]